MSTPTVTETKRAGNRAPSTVLKPSGRQVYGLARRMADALGLEWPETRAEASALIQRLDALEPAADVAREEVAF